MKLKVCGLKDRDNIIAVESLQGVDFTGFIFVEKSPRNACSLESLPPKNEGVHRVGVFLNATQEEIESKVAMFDLDIVQLHGNESPQFCRSIARSCRVFKAFGIETASDLEVLQSYDDSCEAFILDKKSPLGGGAGEKYDWSILSNYAYQTPYFLSGGIGLADVQALKQCQLPKCIGYDVNSRFESAPGNKKVDEIELFIEQIKK
jgi:phosphoribosylanthranilate isomerase